jgi:hypothetical protein
MIATHLINGYDLKKNEQGVSPCCGGEDVKATT